MTRVGLSRLPHIILRNQWSKVKHETANMLLVSCYLKLSQTNHTYTNIKSKQTQLQDRHIIAKKLFCYFLAPENIILTKLANIWHQHGARNWQQGI